VGRGACFQQGLQPSHHQEDEVLKKGFHVVRARARFRVTLEAEGRAVGALDAL